MHIERERKKQRKRGTWAENGEIRFDHIRVKTQLAESIEMAYELDHTQRQKTLYAAVNVCVPRFNSS